jgi:hypothetical protein
VEKRSQRNVRGTVRVLLLRPTAWRLPRSMRHLLVELVKDSQARRHVVISLCRRGLHARGGPRAWSESTRQGLASLSLVQAAALVRRSGERPESASPHRGGALTKLARLARRVGGRPEASVLSPGGCSRPGACAWPRCRCDYRAAARDRASERWLRQRCVRDRHWWSARRRHSSRRRGR